MIDSDRPPDRTAANKADLGRFLRARREALSPGDVGLEPHGRRRTPGLRREEVAYLADIGAAWYARLEMGHDVNASPSTLLAISRALHLTIVETRYLFTLAALPIPLLLETGTVESTIPEAIELMIQNVHDIGLVVWDHYMTAMRWNAIADAMFGFSTSTTHLERNSVLRLLRNTAPKSYYGDDYLPLLRSLIGIFRRAYIGGEPPPHAVEIYEAALQFPRFQEIWNEQVVADLFDAHTGPFERHHATLGTYNLVATNLRISRREDIMLRIITPGDDHSAKQFEKLKALGTASVRPPSDG